MREKPEKKKVLAVSESYFVGEEPVWGDPKKEISIHRALSWYSNQKDWKDSKKYTIDYAKSNNFPKEIVNKLSEASEDLYRNLGFVCRIISRGGNFDKIDWINSRIQEIISYDRSVQKNSSVAPEKPVNKTIQDRIFEQATFYINEIEGHIDEFIKNRKANFNCYDYLTINSIKSVYLSQIKDHYTPLLEELTLAYNKKDDQLTESYSHWSKKELNSFVSFVESIIKDCENFASNSKVVKKVKKKKSVSVDKKVAKVQYKKEDVETKLVSISPAEIIGATQLWVYNVKYKRLGLYKSKDEAGFSIKGTTIVDFDETFSIQKTLRKPLETLTEFKSAKKTDLRKFLQNITTKESIMNGRLNSDTILLKVVK